VCILNSVSSNDYTDWFEFFNKRKKVILWVLFYILHFTFYILHPLYGIEVYLQLRRHGQRVNLGLNKFFAEKTEEEDFAEKIRKVVRSDLLFTRFFDLIEGETSLSAYSYWKDIGTELLITGEIRTKKEDIILSGRLIDLKTEEAIFAKIYETKKDYWREIAHRFSDEIIFRFTGERSITQSKIVFVNNVSGHKEVYLIDYDGENLQKLTEDSSLALLPRWEPDRKGIIYTSYCNGNPDLYRLHFNKRKREPLFQYQGLNLAGSFSKDGKYLVLTLTKDGNPEIYLFDQENKNLRRLTYSKGVDIAPSFSPNNREIVFVSDREGRPQIYVIDIEGLNLRKLTMEGYCDSPVWSPRGDLIAFARRENGYSQVYTISVDGKNERKLTFEGSNENPSFSPDGRWLVFCSSRNNKYELYRMYIDGSFQQRIAEIPGDCRTPAWSP